MFHILSWLAVYLILLFGMNRAAGAFRKRRWFKALFFPGTLLAAGVQAVSARLCVAPAFRISLLADRRPAFAFTRERVPCLGGALFLLASQTLLYAIFLGISCELDLVARLDAWELSLPSVHLMDLFRGKLDLDIGGFLSSLRALAEASIRHPFLASCALYLAAGTLASLRFDGKESFWALIMLSFLALLAHIGESFGVGFPFLSRGWWAGIFYFPQWWTLFSLFIVLAGLSLIAILLLWGAVFGSLLILGGKRPARRPERVRAGTRS